MISPVATTTQRKRPTSVTRASSTYVVITEVPQPRAIQHKKLKELRLKLISLTTTEGNPEAFTRGRLLPLLIRAYDVPPTRRVLLPTEMRRPQEGQDESQNGRVHDQPRAI